VWVLQNCSEVATARTGGYAICGVGSANSDANPDDAMKIAQANAKADISKKLNTRIKSILIDYRSLSIKDGKSLETENSEEIIIEISSAVLKGVEIIDSWKTKNGTLFVLMGMNAENINLKPSDMSNIPNDEIEAIEKGLKKINF
jgi:hypothetical protein